MLKNLLTMGYYATALAKILYAYSSFVLFNHSTCRPEDENTLRKDGSYHPSGHTAYGTLLALVLSEARPERAQELARRGWGVRAKAEVICGAHWQVMLMLAVMWEQ